MIKLSWEKYGKMSLDERRDFFIKKHTNYKKLEKKLFKFGGTRLIYEPEMDNKLCDKLLLNAKINTEEFTIIGDEFSASLCHMVSAHIAALFKVDHYEGYALSEDGLWRHHSWVKDGDKFEEVTPVGRVMYFGVKV